MKTVTHSPVFPYREELIIELTGNDANGEVVVLTDQFEYTEDHPKRVQPKGGIPTGHQPIVEGLLDEHDSALR